MRRATPWTSRTQTVPFRNLFMIAAIVWTTVAFAVFLVELEDQKNLMTANLLSTAKASFEKDLAFRRWAAGHGGVYVPVTEETQPNPYLQVPERDISTPSGQRLTRMNPAYMIRQVFETSRSSDDSPREHITSLKPLRPENAADSWERKALEAFEKGIPEFSGFQTIDGKPYFRFMRPLLAEKPCLKCHAPQGYREGDIRGGISVSIPMGAIYESVAGSNLSHALIILLVWLSGSGGLWFSYLKVRGSSQALQESEERYRQQFQQSQAVMLIINPDDASIEEANPAAVTYYGFSPEKLRTMKITDINCAAPEDVMLRLAEVRAGVARRFQFQHRLADGSVRDVEVFSSPIRSGDSLLLHAIIFDVSDRLAAERQLCDKMDFAENLILNSTAPTFVIDADHKVLIWNRALEELTGVRASEVIGTIRHWLAFYATCRPCLADIVIDGKNAEAEAFYPHVIPSRLIPDGLHAEGDYLLNNRECRLVFASAPIRDQSGKIIAAIETLEDITARISLEAQLLQSQKMESVGALAGGVAHDFNNVLTVINGYADLLQMTLAENDENRNIAREISASVDRAAEMTRSLLAFSGKQTMTPQYDDLNQILESIRKSLGRLIREDITLSIQPGTGRLPVYVDRVQIEQVLINLVVNARDAVATGGAITVSTLPVLLEKPRLDGSFVIPPGRYVCLSVADSGAGMSAETISRIFEPFYTTKKRGKGTGLGLSIVHGIVTRHGGQITVVSTPGNGTEFRVYLPQYEGKQQPKESGTARPVNYHGSETILIAEDDTAIMNLFCDVLGRHGYTVLSASDGVEALRLFEEHRDQIGMAIVDVIMPRMNGREVVEGIRRMLPDLPVMMVSGYTDEIIDRAAIDDLKVVFMQKPVKPLEMLAAIRTGLQGGN